MSGARLVQTDTGTEPASDGWFVVNVADARWYRNDQFGAGTGFESDAARFPEIGVRIRVLQPGQSNCYYHRENAQENFLVLDGECLLLVDGEERHLRTWDFVHCPPDVDHVFVGAGSTPCALLMLGARKDDEQIVYPVSDLALEHHAGVTTETTSPDTAYADVPPWSYGRPTGWSSLPWARDRA